MKALALILVNPMPPLWRRIESIVKLLHGKRPEGRIIIMGLLPRVPLSAAAAAAAPGTSAARAASILDDGGGATAALATQAKARCLLGACLRHLPYRCLWRCTAGCGGGSARCCCSSSSCCFKAGLDSHKAQYNCWCFRM